MARFPHQRSLVGKGGFDLKDAPSVAGNNLPLAVSHLTIK
jgi:hypothetical protein